MNFSHFFIRRPIFAGVLSIADLPRRPARDVPAAHQRISRSRAADHRRARHLSRARIPRPSPRPSRRRSNRPSTASKDSLYMFSQATRRRRDDADRDVQARHGRGQGAGAGAEPRVAGAAQVAGGSPRASASPPRSNRPTSRWSCTCFRRTTATTRFISATTPRLQVKDVLARIPGAGDVRVFGSGDYAMRVWLNPDKIAARNLTASDVVAAIREQNVQVAAGAIGQQPVQLAGEFRTAGQRQGPADLRRRNSARSSSRPGRTAKRRCSRTSPASNWAPAATRCARC